MCGIAGRILLDPCQAKSSSEQLSRRFAASLSHRGPDDAGHWEQLPGDGPSALLIHQRLSIQDLSAAGHQPMHSACGRYVLVFNGEIYNQRELRLELEALGQRFLSGSDTEVLLALLAREGRSALLRLRHVCRLWDREQRTALLARDPYGMKPLYFWQGSEGELLFASELRALLASGLVERCLNASALTAFLSAGSVPEPFTLVDGVQSLLPGHSAEWSKGSLTVEPFWRPPFASAQQEPISQQDATERCRQALERSVQAHLLGDVPVGLFLSGGLDSAAVLALAPRGLKTLTIGFSQASHDESARASELACQFGAHHISLQVDAYQAAELLPAFLSAIDQPTVDGFNSFCVSALARQQGLKVVLSGLGGDELFGGYPSFSRIPRLLHLHRRLGPLRPVLAHLLSQHPSHRKQRLAAFLAGPGTADAAHRCQRGLLPSAKRCSFFNTGSWKLLIQPVCRLCPSYPRRDRLVESRFYMGQQLLRDSDVFSMAHGLELRLPFVDAQLLEEPPRFQPHSASPASSCSSRLCLKSERLPLRPSEASSPFRAGSSSPIHL